MSKWLVGSLTAVCVSAIAPVQTQSQSSAGAVYKTAESSVFLIYVNDSTGQPTALGSGFLVAPRLIVTNAHVVADGTPVIAVGPVRIPAKVVRTDELNDLALLSVEVDLTSKPLIVSKNRVETGDRVFVIGNPEGLEKTLSEGIISSLREEDGRKLLQITNPISHGSSGGPVLDQKGEVVGITVSMLKEGQNLNFAVPAAELTSFMNSSQGSSSGDLRLSLATIKSTIDGRTEEYSKDDDSQYQVKSRVITRLFNEALTSTDADFLIGLARLAQNDDYSISLKAARKSEAKRESAEAKLLIAEDLSFLAIFSNSADKTEKQKEAETYAENAVKQIKMPTREYLTTLAYAKEDLGKNAEALSLYKKSLSAPDGSPVMDRKVAIRGAIRNTTALSLDSDRRGYFKQLVATGDVSADEWSDEAYRLLESKDVDHALEAISDFQQASKKSTDGIYSCRAALNETFQPGFNLDVLLADSKDCLAKEAIKPTENITDLNGTLAKINVGIANALNRRGVYTEALNYAREATKIAPSDFSGFDAMGDALHFLQRYNESVAAEKEAIRLSNGKYSFTHFRLGTSYFELEQWKPAQASFEQAFQGDPTNDNVAYNIALCYQRQGYSVDAVQWYRKVLKLNPDREDKADILALIGTLSR